MGEGFQFQQILFYCRYGIWSYSRATRCSSELHWPSGRAWKSEFIPVKINRKILLIFLSNIKKHPGCDQRGRVLQRNGAALQGDARVEQQGLQQTHQGEFHLEAIWASIAKAIIKWLVVALLTKCSMVAGSGGDVPLPLHRGLRAAREVHVQHYSVVTRHRCGQEGAQDPVQVSKLRRLSSYLEFLSLKYKAW